jgi:hypothetical protein
VRTVLTMTLLVVGERVERPGGEVPERGDHESVGRSGLAVDPAGRPVFDPAERPVVARPDGVEYPAPHGSGAEQGEHPERLLCGEGEVVGDPYRGRSASFEVAGEVLPGDDPAALGAPVGDDVGVAGLAAGGDRVVDVGPVVFVVAGQPAEVAGGDPGQAGGLAEGELVVGIADGPDRFRSDSCLPGWVAAGQLGLRHEATAARVDDRDQERPGRLA